ncbi:hypothetical protein Ddye_004742 [Dipteronia dyeriana]|uniref:Protein KAKU4 n=1 Tax=Dipteronia dyeriana TaxID=168575 RepID=A0AAE0CP33_9ROSI|nr:hypothetical protein Ddye_004742 [Dipteronia dyeriana]
MSSISRPRRATEPRSGGKLVRARRTAGPKTPYDRPPPTFSPNPSYENPNWLSRLIYSPTRMIASGAGKLLSSVFTTDSSSSSSSGSGSGSDDIDDDNDDDGISSQETDTMKKNGTAETIMHIRREYQPMVEKSENKCMIEQLLMQEIFSREECDRLIRIIKSRVIDSHMIGDAENKSLSELPSGIIDSDSNMPEFCSAAVTEAKKWLEKKKSGSNSKSTLDLGPCTLNTAMLLDFTEGEAGSPVDVAKSFMQTRPPWASPSTSYIGYRSPSPTGTQLFKEETPYSLGCSSSSASKMKKDSSTSAKWSISEELRKVRSKATEEMLRSLPSSKINWSSFALGHKIVSNSLVADDIEARMRDKMQSSTKSIDTSSNLATGVTTSYGFPVSQVTQDELQNEALTPNPTTLITELNQNVDDSQTMEETGEGRLSSEQGLQSLEDIKTVSQSDVGAVNIDGLRDTNGATQLLNPIMEGTIQDSELHNQNCTTSKEVDGTGDSFVANGFPSSGLSLSAGHEPPDTEHNPDPVGLDHNTINPTAPVEEAIDFLSEASKDVPIVFENDILPSGSQNSSSMCIEGISQDIKESSKLGVTSKTNGTSEKHKGKKLGKYNRRGLRTRKR